MAKSKRGGRSQQRRGRSSQTPAEREPAPVEEQAPVEEPAEPDAGGNDVVPEERHDWTDASDEEKLQVLANGLDPENETAVANVRKIAVAEEESPEVRAAAQALIDGLPQPEGTASSSVGEITDVSATAALQGPPTTGAGNPDASAIVQVVEPPEGLVRRKVALGKHLYYAEVDGVRRQRIAPRGSVIDVSPEEAARGEGLGALVDVEEDVGGGEAVDPRKLDDTALAEWVAAAHPDTVVSAASDPEIAARLLEAEGERPSDPRIEVVEGIRALLGRTE